MTNRLENYNHEESVHKDHSKTNNVRIISANELVSRHPIVNESFINKIVAEIQAKHDIIKPLLKKPNARRAGKSSALKQLIDDVANNVVKDVMQEFSRPTETPSRPTLVPKTPYTTKAPISGQMKMPVLNENGNDKDDMEFPEILKDVIKNVKSDKEEDLSPEMTTIDEIAGPVSRIEAPEIVKPASVMSPTSRLKGFRTDASSRVSNILNASGLEKPELGSPKPGLGPERPGLQEIQELLRLKPHRRDPKPKAAKGKKKVDIPATIEGEQLRCKRHILTLKSALVFFMFSFLIQAIQRHHSLKGYPKMLSVVVYCDFRLWMK